jgi:hypothetical protein
MGQKDWFTFFEGAVAGMGWARCCIVAERNVLKEAGFFRSGYSAAEDLDICIRIAFIYPEIGFVALPLAEYNFRRENSISSQSYIDLVKARCQNLDDLIELSERYGNRKTFKPLAGKLLADWSSNLLGEEIDENMLIRYILNHFNRLLPMNYKIEVRLKIMFPRISGFLFNKYFMLKKSLGLSKNR